MVRSWPHTMASGYAEFRWSLLALAARKPYRKGHFPLWVILAPGLTRVHDNGLGYTEFDAISSCTQTLQKRTIPIMHTWYLVSHECALMVTATHSSMISAGCSQTLQKGDTSHYGTCLTRVYATFVISGKKRVASWTNSKKKTSFETTRVRSINDQKRLDISFTLLA